MLDQKFREELLEAIAYIRKINYGNEISDSVLLQGLEAVIERNTEAGDEQHIYHHSDNDKPKVGLKVEKNSRGYNYEATVTNCSSIPEALDLMREAIVNLKLTYGGE